MLSRTLQKISPTPAFNCEEAVKKKKGKKAALLSCCLIKAVPQHNKLLTASFRCSVICTIHLLFISLK